jgi:ribosomal protein L16 Arg81 hydroxylase
MQLDKKIDVLPHISYDDFIKNYYQPQKPLIIRQGIVNEQTSCHQWSLDWFKQNYGNVLVDVFDNHNLDHKKSAVTKPDATIPFKDFINHIQKDEASHLRLFLFKLFKVAPELQQDFNCPQIMKGLLGKIGFAFFGGKNTEVKMHYDVDMSSVLLTQFEGRKRVILFEPKYSKLLYRTPFNMHSLVNVIKPDYIKFPALKYVKGYDFILQPGDSLFMPSGYWHYNTYLEGGFAIAYRKLSPSIFSALIGCFNIFILIPLDKLILRLFKDKWYHFKNRMAAQMAEKAIKKIEQEKTSSEWHLA